MSNSLSQMPAKTMRPTYVRARVGSRMSGSSAKPMRNVVSATAPPAQVASTPANIIALNPRIRLSLCHDRTSHAGSLPCCPNSIVSSARRFRDGQRIARSPEEFLQPGEVGVAPQLTRRRQGRLRNLDLAPEMTCRAMHLGGAVLFQDRLLGPATLACMRAAR